MIKVTVSTVTFRNWDFLKQQAECLRDQTIPHDEFEWIVVDDLYEQRKDWLKDLPFKVKHLPPHILTDTSEACAAVNTSLIHAEGELVHFMADYMLIAPKVLERHWHLYEQYGPHCIISGPVQTLHDWRRAERRIPDIMLGIDVGEIRDIDKIRRWYWASKNDSASLHDAIHVNGFDERLDNYSGGADVEFAMRMVKSGCRYLIDLVEQSWEYDHSGRKRQRGWSADPRALFDKAARSETLSSLWAPNKRDLGHKRLDYGYPLRLLSR